MKAIVTVTGKDAVGIIAGVCQELQVWASTFSTSTRLLWMAFLP